MAQNPPIAFPVIDDGVCVPYPTTMQRYEWSSTLYVHSKEVFICQMALTLVSALEETQTE